MNRLAGKVAVMTGAGSGIGCATATLFAREGARVAVVDLTGDRAQETVAGITQAGGTGIALQADVSKSESVSQMVDRTLDRWGRIDILHNNAGISMNATPVEDIDDAFFDRMLATNVRGVYLGAKHAVPAMKRQRSGVIINAASTAGVRPRPGASAYAASKGAVIALTKALAVELAPSGGEVDERVPGGRLSGGRISSTVGRCDDGSRPRACQSAPRARMDGLEGCQIARRVR